MTLRNSYWNVVAERMNLILIKLVPSMLYNKENGIEFWVEALNVVPFVRN